MITKERWYELNEYALDIAFENTTEEEFADKEPFIEAKWQSFDESQVDDRT